MNLEPTPFYINFLPKGTKGKGRGKRRQEQGHRQREKERRQENGEKEERMQREDQMRSSEEENDDDDAVSAAGSTTDKRNKSSSYAFPVEHEESLVQFFSENDCFYNRGSRLYSNPVHKENLVAALATDLKSNSEYNSLCNFSVIRSEGYRVTTYMLCTETVWASYPYVGRTGAMQGCSYRTVGGGRRQSPPLM